MRLLRNADHRRMPWKNGGGETVEVIVHPQGSGLADFGWRVSMAMVASDGPFSVFPGIDRTLSIIQGAGMALTIDGHAPVVLTQASEPLAFAADAATTAALVSGPIIDLNVMTRRGAFVHWVERRTITGEQHFSADGGITLLLALGDMRVEIGSQAAELGPFDAMILDSEVRMTTDIPAPVYLIRITPA